MHCLLVQNVMFLNGNMRVCASGNKLSVAYKAGSIIVKTDYVGNKVYKNGTLSMLHTEEGYITFSGATQTYHYYLKDHQGNNRVVMNQNGAVEQLERIQ